MTVTLDRTSTPSTSSHRTSLQDYRLQSDKARAIQRFRELKKYQWTCQLANCDGLPHVGMPHKHARSNQLVRDSDDITAFITGRGFGKSRAGAEWSKARMLGEDNHRLLIVVPIFAAGRDICIEGESGLLAVLPPDRVKDWNRSMGELKLVNGSIAKIFGCKTKEDAEAIRGYQSHSVWFEELATCRYDQLAWDMAQFANRLGRRPKVVITTTPKPKPLIKKLMKDRRVRVVRGSTFDNAANLPDVFLDSLRDTYAGTRLGRQELDGEVIEEIVGALFSQDIIDIVDPETVIETATGVPLHMDRVVVAVDPAGSHKATSDLTGIVVVGVRGGHIYVFEDLSGRYTPEGWARTAIDAYERNGADCIVGEVNFGADMVKSTVTSISSQVRFKEVHASRGKAVRAEPVVGIYQQGRGHHVPGLADLENQMCSWVPPGQFETDANGVSTAIEPSTFSPDRMDALVWGVTDLVLQPAGKKKARMRFEQ